MATIAFIMQKLTQQNLLAIRQFISDFVIWFRFYSHRTDSLIYELYISGYMFGIPHLYTICSTCFTFVDRRLIRAPQKSVIVNVQCQMAFVFNTF